MRPTRFSFRQAAVIAAATALVASTLFAPSPALAAPAIAPDGIAAADATAALADRLGDQTAGTYLDRNTGQMVVNITDPASVEAVRAAGATPRVVTRSGAALERVTTALNTSALIPGTTWSVDPVANQVLVTVDSTVTGADLARVESVTQRFGDAARIEHMSGTLAPTISGGDAIFGGGSRCSLGFNVRSGSGQQYFLTAGHCTDIASSWFANSARTQLLGARVVSSFPTNDYGVVRYDSGISRPGNVNLYNGSFRDITNSGNAFVNQSVQRSGSTTGVRGGVVTGINTTVTYPQGSVFGMIRTTVCAQGGDSGGSLFAGSTALGLTSGGSGNCSSGGTTFFQPVSEPLNRFGLAVY